MGERRTEHPAADPDGWIRHRMHRRGGIGEVRYLTFSCHDRLMLFRRAETKEAFEAMLCEEAAVAGFLILAWVVMPEHVHVLGVPLRDENVGIWTGRLKSRFARETLKRTRSIQTLSLRARRISRARRRGAA